MLKIFQKIICSIFLVMLFVTAGCLFKGGAFSREVQSENVISSFTTSGDYLYFGAGYKLYRIDTSTNSIETIFTTDRIRVEQPVVADGVAYFGGSSYYDRQGKKGEQPGFFAVDLQSRKVQWKFPLGVGGYGTYGTYPNLAGDRILVCARQHLHSLDRKSGQEIWKIDNWLGIDADGSTLPYIYKNFVYYKIREEFFTKSDANDGNWAKLALDSGNRISIIPIAEKPGTYEDSNGEGIGTLVDGVIYGATRYDSYPTSRFGAFDLEAQKLLWEIDGSQSRSKPAVNGKYVFTDRGNLLQALDRKTGEVVWSEPLGDIAQLDIDRSKDRLKWDFENRYSRRFDATDEIVVAQGSQGIAARKADTGKLLWFTKVESNQGDANPLIFQQMVIVSSAKGCSVFGLDLKTGKEIWRIQIPDCTSYNILDD